MRKISAIVLAFSLTATSAFVADTAAAVGGPPPPDRSIGGSIFIGNSSVRYLYDLADPAGEPIAVFDTCLDHTPAGTVMSPITGDPLTATDTNPASPTYGMQVLPDPGPSSPSTCPDLLGTHVMVQSQHSGGTFITYGTVIGNSWTATVDPVDYPDVIVTFSALGHDVTSREFTWNETASSYTHPIPGTTLTSGAMGINGGGNRQDAYLPPLDRVDPDTGAHTLPTGNLLHYVFYDVFTNGADDGTLIDPGLNCVTINAYDEQGVLLQTMLTGDGDGDGVVDPGNETFLTADGLLYGGANGMPIDGYVYFTGLPSGEIKIESDPSTATQACNPQLDGYRTVPDPIHLGQYLPANLINDNNDAAAASPTDAALQSAAPGWSLTYTEEGGPLWEVPLAPRDPGTEAGAYMTWHGFIENIGQVGGPDNPWVAPPTGSGEFTVTLLDADGNDPVEPFPLAVPGRVDGGYSNGTISSDVEPNARISEGALALYTVGDFPRLIATGRASSTEQNVQTGGTFTFTDVPAGSYELFAYDIPLHNVPMIGNGVTVTSGVHPPVDILVPRFGARIQGTVMNGVEPVVGATLKVHYKSGITKSEATTDIDGFFNFEYLPEVEVMGHVFVELPDGSTYRGRVITEQFKPVALNPDGTVIPNPTQIAVTHNAQNRYVQWATVNYWADI